MDREDQFAWIVGLSPNTVGHFIFRWESINLANEPRVLFLHLSHRNYTTVAHKYKQKSLTSLQYSDTICMATRNPSIQVRETVLQHF